MTTTECEVETTFIEKKSPRFKFYLERQTSVLLQMLSINIMLGIGQCGDGRCITHIRLDTTLLPEWLHFGTDWPHLSGTDTGAEKGILALFPKSDGFTDIFQGRLRGLI